VFCFVLQAGGGGEFVVRNFVGVIQDISIEASTVETELFPKGALEYYTKKNMGWEYTQEEYDTWQLAERGGAQGDYREGMQEKIANVIDCLKTEPLSKRAVIPIPFATEPSSTIDWKDQGQNKCCRELHFYLEDGKLKCTGIVRMQNVRLHPIFVVSSDYSVFCLMVVALVSSCFCYWK
jgi:thymidylate synthase